jgi:hypothetical protein
MTREQLQDVESLVEGGRTVFGHVAHSGRSTVG